MYILSKSYYLKDTSSNIFLPDKTNKKGYEYQTSEAYLEPSCTYMKESFRKNSQWFLDVSYFCKKPPS